MNFAESESYNENAEVAKIRPKRSTPSESLTVALSCGSSFLLRLAVSLTLKMIYQRNHEDKWFVILAKFSQYLQFMNP